MKISASVVTYNNEKEIRGVLNSLVNSDCVNLMDIFVVDNCSTDKTVEIIEEEYPQIRLIRSPKNGGYGYGHNQALCLSNADYHFVINPDIIFEPTLISAAIKFMDDNPDTVIAIPNIYDEDNQLKMPPKRDPKVRYLIARFFPTIGVFQKWRDSYVAKDLVLMSDGKTPYEIEICSGSFMILRRKVAEEVGFFDERYFMYFEDFDLSRSVRANGRIVCLPQLKVIHEGKRAAHSSKTARNMMLDSMWKYFRKWGFKL